MIIAFSVQCTADISKWFTMINRRLSSGNMVNNPFIGSVKHIQANIYAVDITPIYPDISWLGIPYLAGLWFINPHFNLWMLPGAFILACHIFWSRWFYFLMIYLSIKKIENVAIRIIPSEDFQKILLHS